MISRPEHDIDPAELSDSSRRELLDRHLSHAPDHRDRMSDAEKKCLNDNFGPIIGELADPKTGDTTTVIVGFTRKPCLKVTVHAPTWMRSLTPEQWEERFAERFTPDDDISRFYLDAALEGEYGVLAKSLGLSELSYAAAMYDDARMAQMKEHGLDGSEVPA